MKKLFTPPFALILVLISIAVAHCSKKVEEVQKDLVVQAMTSGRWVVQAFTENGTDVTTEFAPFEFQFLENGTVQGINGSFITTGNWVGDAKALTIFSNFPSAGLPIMRLNDTWKITNNTLSLVEAKPLNTGRTAYLKLVKK